MGEVSFFRCERCGNIITKIIDAGPTPFCCGEQMVELTANTVDAAVEKHVPVISIDGDKVTVTVGAVDHPMLEEHYIQWICLHTQRGLQFAMLKPGDKPQAIFALAGDTALGAYAYCNLHGLWSAQA
jgi:superoxide reductase